MAHPAQQEFCREVKGRFPEFFSTQRVLEIGARNVNGSVRDEFTDCQYIGVDCQAGPDVDVVCFGHEYEHEANAFDVVCSTETFEHDPHAAETLQNMLRLLRQGGLFFMTCAGEGRHEHGTKRMGDQYGPKANFYHNVTLGELLAWLDVASGRFEEFYVRHDRGLGDLYCFAVKTES